MPKKNATSHPCQPRVQEPNGQGQSPASLQGLEYCYPQRIGAVRAANLDLAQQGGNILGFHRSIIYLHLNQFRQDWEIWRGKYHVSFQPLYLERLFEAVPYPIYPKSFPKRLDSRCREDPARLVMHVSYGIRPYFHHSHQNQESKLYLARLSYGNFKTGYDVMTLHRSLLRRSRFVYRSFPFASLPIHPWSTITPSGRWVVTFL
jgi:hypothetical protein